MSCLKKKATKDWDCNLHLGVRCAASSQFRKISGTGEYWVSWCFKRFIWLRCFHSTWSALSVVFPLSGLFLELSTLFQVVSFFWKFPNFPFILTKLNCKQLWNFEVILLVWSGGTVIVFFTFFITWFFHAFTKRAFCGTFLNIFRDFIVRKVTKLFHKVVFVLNKKLHPNNFVFLPFYLI